MELMQAIEKRRTVRDFLDKPVAQSVIEKALCAGLKAPSYNHRKRSILYS
jgi:nitroreductase